MATLDPSTLTGPEKASILLMTLGAEMSAETLRLLTEQEIELLAPEMVRLQSIDPQLRDAVLMEFEQMSVSASAGGAGKGFTSQVLQEVLGEEKARELIEQSSAVRSGRPFASLSDVDAAQLAKVLSVEQPQLIGLVLTNLPPEKGAAVMSLLDDETQIEVAMRIASTVEIGANVIAEIEEVLKANLASGGKDASGPVGSDALVELLSRAERSTERLVLEALNEREPDMGAEVRRKMFLFEDIIRLPDRAVQLLLREVDQEPLRVALKGASDEIQMLLFRNMSERAAESLKEDLELLQNVKTKDIEAAQQQIGITVRRLLTKGEIVLDEEDEESMESMESMDSMDSMGGEAAADDSADQA